MASAPDLNGNTIEKQLVELTTRIQMLESSTDTNPQGENRVTGTYNQDTGVYSGSFSIACSPTISDSGVPSFEAKEYLSDPTFAG